MDNGFQGVIYYFIHDDCVIIEKIIQIIQKYWHKLAMEPQYQLSFQYDEDSFEQDQDSDHGLENRKVPLAIPANNTQLPKSSSNNRQKIKNEDCYQLTFKKQNQFKFLGKLQNNSQLSQKLFRVSEQNPEKKSNSFKILKTNSNKKHQNKNMDALTLDQQFISLVNKSRSVQQIYQSIKTNQFHKNLKCYLKQPELLRILQQNQCSQITQIKLRTIVSLVIFKNLRKKRNSVRLNIQVIRNQIDNKQKQITETSKKRLELLQLLKIQLDKKIFVEGLKCNKMFIFCQKVLASIDYQQENQFLQQNSEDFQNSQQNQEVPANYDLTKHQTKNTQHRTNYLQQPNRRYQTESPYHQQSRLAIFIQIISSLINKKLYPALKQLMNLKITQKDKMKRYNSPQEEQDQDIIKSSQFLDNYPEQDNVQPIIQLKNYLQQLSSKLIRGDVSPKQLLKNYFIRWKIFFIDSIIKKIENNEKLTHNQYQKCQQQQENLKSEGVMLSDYNSNKSVQKNLKEPKYLLKQFLQLNSKRVFFRLLDECIASKGIKEVTLNYSRKNLLKKSFYGLFHNKQQRLNNRWIQQYAQRMAQNQDQSQRKLSQIFYKTNNFTKMFFGWKKVIRWSKFCNIMQKFVVKHSFLQLKHSTNENIQNQTKLKRFIERKNRKKLFKAFSMIKNETSYSEQLNNRVKQFRAKKYIQLLQICFSAMSLAWKKQLALQKRIQNIICISSIRTFFDKFKIGVLHRQQQENLEFYASQVVNILNKKTFFMKFRQKYFEYLKQRSIKIKQTKIYIENVRNHAKQGLKRWRKLHIRNNNYKIIQKKLIKVKQNEQKQKILKIWYERLIQKYQIKKKDKITLKHKVWLNKYYEKLCNFEQEELS